MAKKNILIKKKNGALWDELYPITTANNVKCSDGKDIESQLGDITTLKTTDKTSLVTAVNELFTSASDGKNKIATAYNDIKNSEFINSLIDIYKKLEGINFSA